MQTILRLFQENQEVRACWLFSTISVDFRHKKRLSTYSSTLVALWSAIVRYQSVKSALKLWLRFIDFEVQGAHVSIRARGPHSKAIYIAKWQVSNGVDLKLSTGGMNAFETLAS